MWKLPGSTLHIILMKVVLIRAFSYWDEYYPEYGEFYPNENDRTSMPIRLKEVEELLSSVEARVFLEQFSDLKNEVVYTQLLYCPYTPLCGFSLNLSLPNFKYVPNCSVCSCSDDCVIYRTCCPDILPEEIFKPGKPNVVAMKCPEAYSFPNQTIDNSCASALLLPSLNFAGFCIQDAIEQQTDAVAMFDGFLGKPNLTCNLCYNNESRFHTIPDFSCPAIQEGFISPENNFLRNLIENKGRSCGISLSSEVADLNNTYCTVSITSCNTSSHFNGSEDPHFAACSSFYSAYYFDGIRYGNVFCLLCNGFLPNQTTYKLIDGTQADVFAFSGLLKLSPSTPDKTLDPNEDCSNGKVYNSALERCFKASCSPMRRLENGNCVKVVQQMSGVTYDVFLRLFPNESLSLGASLNYSESVVDLFKYYVDSNFLNVITIKCSTIEVAHTVKLGDEPSLRTGTDFKNLVVDYIDVRIEIFIEDFHNSENILEMFEPLDDDDVVFSTIPGSFRVYIRDYNMDRDVFRNAGFFTHNINTTNLLELLDMSIAGVVTFPANQVTVIDSKFYDNWISCGPVSSKSNILVFQPIPKILVNKLDYGWRENSVGSVIVIEGTELELKSSDYLYTNDEELVAIHNNKLFQPNKRRNENNGTKAMPLDFILSFILLPISIVSLALTLLIYSEIAELRSLPGINIMTLSAFLALAQSLYLIGSFSGFEKESVACKTFGLGIHFSWLMSVSWMNICTFHTFRVFVREQFLASIFKRRTYFAYHIYSLAVSLVFVSINIVFSMLSSNGDDFGYGRDVCYLSSQRMLEFTFGIPVGIMILGNIILFVLVVVFVSRSNTPLRKSKERNDMIIFAKLSTMTGVMWIFGFVHSWTNISAFSYLFILLNGGQGVFLCLSFTVNRRVYSIFKKRWLDSMASSRVSGEPRGNRY